MTLSMPAFSQQLAMATRTWHTRAEQSGVMPALLRGALPRDDYHRLLRNFAALYAALETAMDAHASSPLVAPIRMPELYRTAALREDLLALVGPDWASQPLTAAMDSYVQHIGTATRTDPARLAAHAYVRYMGDLSGGQMLHRIVARTLALDDGAGTAFYRFDQVPDIIATKQRFRAALDALPLDASHAAAVTAEAVDAFARHVALFEELATATTAAPRAG